MTSRRWTLAVVTAAIVVAIVGVVIVSSTLSEWGRQRREAFDVILRASRLAGYPEAAAGGDWRESTVALTLPLASSAADIELAWQTGMAMLAAADPKSRTYRVVVATTDSPLLRISGSAGDVRDAVEANDSQALRDAVDVEFLASSKGVDVTMPEHSTTTDGQTAELDRANRASGMSSVNGPSVRDAEALRAAWEKAYAAAPGVPAAIGGVEAAAQFAADRIREALSRVGEDARIEQQDAVEALVPDLLAAADVSSLRTWAAACEAATAEKALPSVLALTASATREIAKTGHRGSGPGKYVAKPLAVSSLERVQTLDAAASAEGTGVVAKTLARHGVMRDGKLGLVWRAAEESQSASPLIFGSEGWQAYRASDGTIYWSAVPGDVALTDTSLRGWGYITPSVSLVDAKDPLRVVAEYPGGASR